MPPPQDYLRQDLLYFTGILTGWQKRDNGIVLGQLDRNFAIKNAEVGGFVLVLLLLKTRRQALRS
ncbi:Uncharacterised protein [Cedecea neteri]|uniref:Uncharacterized protein n=1 Tax=Cedecea neteri TaxID=158822 RepID=A0A2X2SVZ2_9ENTR|nr:Uncharacterised protein [Cedecea neteri]